MADARRQSWQLSFLHGVALHLFFLEEQSLDKDFFLDEEGGLGKTCRMQHSFREHVRLCKQCALGMRSSAAFAWL
jgi:hypothetical protein